VNRGKNTKNLKPFQKGADNRRNLKGRPLKLPALDKLMADIMGEEKDGKSAAEAILMAIRAKASRGDIKAAELLLDRAYGKAKQVTEEIGNKDMNLNIKFVKANGS
jgi:hypothetical protein